MLQQWEQLCCRGTVLPALASKVGQTRGKAFRRALLVQNPTRQPTKITICLSFEERRIPGQADQADQDDQACQATARSYTTAQEKTCTATGTLRPRGPRLQQESTQRKASKCRDLSAL